MSDDDEELDASNAAEHRTLIRVLLINLSQVLLAGVVGVMAQSTGLLGAALDNLGAAAVYVVSLYAVGRSVAAKARAARLSGMLLIANLGIVLSGIAVMIFASRLLRSASRFPLPAACPRRSGGHAGNAARRAGIRVARPGEREIGAGGSAILPRVAAILPRRFTVVPRAAPILLRRSTVRPRALPVRPLESARCRGRNRDGAVRAASLSDGGSRRRHCRKFPLVRVKRVLAIADVTGVG